MQTLLIWIRAFWTRVCDPINNFTCRVNNIPFRWEVRSLYFIRLYQCMLTVYELVRCIHVNYFITYFQKWDSSSDFFKLKLKLKNLTKKTTISEKTCCEKPMVFGKPNSLMVIIPNKTRSREAKNVSVIALFNVFGTQKN